MGEQAAYTNSSGLYPAYVNAHVKDGFVRITLREDSPDGIRCGLTIAMKMPISEFALFLLRSHKLVGA